MEDAEITPMGTTPCNRKTEIPVLEAATMDEIYDALARRIIPTAAAAANLNFKYIVGVAGSPGAGKSTLASEVARRVNKLWAQRSNAMESLVNSPEVAIGLPMDGFHLYRHQLDKMENPKEAHARRGAPWTFNPALLLQCLQKLRNEGSVCMPSFDHGVGDPVEDDIFVSLQHKVMIVEGNYLLLEDDIWKDVSSIFDEKWFLEADLDTAMQRVIKRFISEMDRPLDIAKWQAYKKWCKYLDRKSSLWLPTIQQEVQQRKLLYMGLYLLIWGEAANLRFMPECLCYIYHHMAFELYGMLAGNVSPMTGENVKPAYGGEEEAFLRKVVTLIYETIAKEAERSKRGKSKHSQWRNYDDLNEYFWSVDCFRLGWPMPADSDFFCEPTS